jgi:hypothetical protein
MCSRAAAAIKAGNKFPFSAMICEAQDTNNNVYKAIKCNKSSRGTGRIRFIVRNSSSPTHKHNFTRASRNIMLLLSCLRALCFRSNQMYREEIELGRNLPDEIFCGLAFVSVIAKNLELVRRYDIFSGSYEKEWELTKLYFSLKGMYFICFHPSNILCRFYPWKDGPIKIIIFVMMTNRK